VRAHPGEAPENLNVTSPCTRPFALRLALPALVAAAVLSAGCSTVDGWMSGSKVDYKSGATRTKGLEVPPDLTQLARDTRFAQPAGGVVSAAGIAQQPGAGVAGGATALQVVAPLAIGDMRIERQGNQRWLSVAIPPEQLFAQVRAFWIERGFTIASESAEAGVLETDWAENRTKLPNDLIRRTLGRLVDNLYDSGERDRYRTRIERGAGGRSEVFITHRGLQEIYTTAAKDTTAWRPRESDPTLEAEFLSRLMVRLGAREDVARSTVAGAAVAAAAPETPARARTIGGRPAATLQVDEPFDRAWRRVGVALDRSGFTVEDRDRTGGLYFVRYADPARPAADKPGFFSRLFSGKNEEGSPALRYRIAVQNDGSERTMVSVLNSTGGPEGSETGQRIVGLLINELR